MSRDSVLPRLSLRLSVTDRCQLRCGYCMPEEGIVCREREAVLSFEEMVELVRILRGAYRIETIRLTGGEPLLRRNLADLVAMLHAEGVPDLALTTNGQELAPLAAELKGAGLRRVNISLDTLDADRYRRMTRGGELGRTLAAVDAARAAGLSPVKLNAVILKGVNDHEVGDLLRYALEHGCEPRFLEIMPIGQGVRVHREDFVAADSIRSRLRKTYGLTPVGREPGASAERYRVTGPGGLEGYVGFIAPCTAPFCADCRRLRVTPDGGLVGCLARGRALPVRDKLNTPSAVLEAVRLVLGEKRTDTAFDQPKIMATIGG